MNEKFEKKVKDYLYEKHTVHEEDCIFSLSHGDAANLAAHFYNMAIHDAYTLVSRRYEKNFHRAKRGEEETYDASDEDCAVLAALGSLIEK